MKNIALGITGSIAAYKAADIANKITKLGYSVTAIMTKSAIEFITPLTIQTLTKNKVYTNLFDEDNPSEVNHIAVAHKADLFLIIPATANIIGKVANGIADDMLSTTIMATKAPVVFAPAMNNAMYENKIVQNNLQKLKEYGYKIIEPKTGYLACGDNGKGKLPSSEEITNYIKVLVKEEK